MGPIYAIILMAFMNGELVTDPDILMSDEAHQLTAQNCPKYAAMVIEKIRSVAPPEVQFVAKCVDFAQLPTAVSAFGSKAK